MRSSFQGVTHPGWTGIDFNGKGFDKIDRIDILSILIDFKWIANQIDLFKNLPGMLEDA